MSTTTTNSALSQILAEAKKTADALAGILPEHTTHSPNAKIVRSTISDFEDLEYYAKQIAKGGDTATVAIKDAAKLYKIDPEKVEHFLRYKIGATKDVMHELHAKHRDSWVKRVDPEPPLHTEWMQNHNVFLDGVSDGKRLAIGAASTFLGGFLTMRSLTPLSQAIRGKRDHLENTSHGLVLETDKLTAAQRVTQALIGTTMLAGGIGSMAYGFHAMSR